MQNPIGEADLEWILHRNCEGTEQLRITVPFIQSGFRRSVLNAIRHSKGLEALANTRNVMAEKQRAYEHLADVVENALDMEKLYQIMGEKTC